MIIPCLHAKYLLLSHPLYGASIREEDADIQLSGDVQADATRVADRGVCTCIGGVCTWRNVKLCILERII